MKKFRIALCIFGIGIASFILVNQYVKPFDSYSNETDKNMNLLNKYPHPSLMLNALEKKEITCNDLTPEFKKLINTYKENTC